MAELPITENERIQGANDRRRVLGKVRAGMPMRSRLPSLETAPPPPSFDAVLGSLVTRLDEDDPEWLVNNDPRFKAAFDYAAAAFSGDQTPDDIYTMDAPSPKARAMAGIEQAHSGSFGAVMREWLGLQAETRGFDGVRAWVDGLRDSLNGNPLVPEAEKRRLEAEWARVNALPEVERAAAARALKYKQMDALDSEATFLQQAGAGMAAFAGHSTHSRERWLTLATLPFTPFHAVRGVGGVALSAAGMGALEAGIVAPDAIVRANIRRRLAEAANAEEETFDRIERERNSEIAIATLFGGLIGGGAKGAVEIWRAISTPTKPPAPLPEGKAPPDTPGTETIKLRAVPVGEEAVGGRVFHLAVEADKDIAVDVSVENKAPVNEGEFDEIIVDAERQAVLRVEGKDGIVEVKDGAYVRIFEFAEADKPADVEFTPAQRAQRSDEAEEFLPGASGGQARALTPSAEGARAAFTIGGRGFADSIGDSEAAQKSLKVAKGMYDILLREGADVPSPEQMFVMQDGQLKFNTDNVAFNVQGEYRRAYSHGRIPPAAPSAKPVARAAAQLEVANTADKVTPLVRVTEGRKPSFVLGEVGYTNNLPNTPEANASLSAAKRMVNNAQGTGKLPPDEDIFAIQNGRIVFRADADPAVVALYRMPGETGGRKPHPLKNGDSQARAIASGQDPKVGDTQDMSQGGVNKTAEEQGKEGVGNAAREAQAHDSTTAPKPEAQYSGGAAAWLETVDEGGDVALGISKSARQMLDKIRANGVAVNNSPVDVELLNFAFRKAGGTAADTQAEAFAQMKAAVVELSDEQVARNIDFIYKLSQDGKTPAEISDIVNGVITGKPRVNKDGSISGKKADGTTGRRDDVSVEKNEDGTNAVRKKKRIAKSQNPLVNAVRHGAWQEEKRSKAWRQREKQIPRKPLIRYIMSQGGLELPPRRADYKRKKGERRTISELQIFFGMKGLPPGFWRKHGGGAGIRDWDDMLERGFMSEEVEDVIRANFPEVVTEDGFNFNNVDGGSREVLRQILAAETGAARGGYGMLGEADQRFLDMDPQDWDEGLSAFEAESKARAFDEEADAALAEYKKIGFTPRDELPSVIDILRREEGVDDLTTATDEQVVRAKLVFDAEEEFRLERARDEYEGAERVAAEAAEAQAQARRAKEQEDEWMRREREAMDGVDENTSTTTAIYNDDGKAGVAAAKTKDVEPPAAAGGAPGGPADDAAQSGVVWRDGNFAIIRSDTADGGFKAVDGDNELGIFQTEIEAQQAIERARDPDAARQMSAVDLAVKCGGNAVEDF